MLDNTTTVYEINSMGCNKFDLCNQIIFDICSWEEKSNIWITAVNIPGKVNEDADGKSLKKQKGLEWMLNKDIFSKIVHHFSFGPSVDLFASRVNNQLPHYVVYHPDPGALHVNAFTIPWENFKAFPPFAILGKVPQKVISNRSTEL